MEQFETVSLTERTVLMSVIINRVCGVVVCQHKKLFVNADHDSRFNF